MSREDDVVTLLLGDAPLMAILTGGVYGFAASGLEGIRRGSTSPSAANYSPTAAAFGTDGFLKPCALVRQGGNVPDGLIADEQNLIDSAVQRVEIYFYQDRGYDQIDLAMARARVVMRGADIDDEGFRPQPGTVVDRLAEGGGLSGASAARQDWVFNNILGG